MSLREIVYLDRDRVHSYISQLTGGMVVQEAASSSSDEKLSGQIKASIKIVEFQVAGAKGSGVDLTTTRIPAHAVLATLENLLRQEELVADASTTTLLPGQIASAFGDATFESWELLASLADSVQGVATLGAKIYAATRGKKTLDEIKEQVRQLEKLIKKHGPRSELDEPTQELARATAKVLTGVSIVDGGYINDVKELVKLFFQNQNHFRITARGKTFVGLLRKENLVGCTMEELLFTYGSKPKASFGTLFYVAEFGRDEELRPEDLPARFQAFAGRGFSFGMRISPIVDSRFGAS